MQDTMRHLIIDQLLVDKKVVTLREMQAVLQVSVPTLKRDLRYMREILGAPIVYSRQKKGYLYKKDYSRNLPDAGGRRLFSERKRYWYSPDELLALAGMSEKVKTFSEDPHSAMAGEFGALSSRMASLFELGGMTPDELLSCVKIIDSPTVHREPALFEVIGAALCGRRRIQIACYSDDSADKKLVMDVSPLRLVHFGARWYVDVFRHDLREFCKLPIENIVRSEVLASEGYSGKLSNIEAELDLLYGLGDTGYPKTARIEFDETVSPFAELEEWHPKQKLGYCGACLQMKVPYREESEIIGRLLRWGPHAQVKEPEELRQKVCKVLEEILSLYRTDSL